MKTMRTIALALVACAAGTAHAADSGFYVGVSGGQASYDFEPLRLTGPIFVPGSIPGGVPVATLNPGLIGTVPTFPVFGGVTAVRVFAEPQRVFWIPGRDEEATSWNVLAGYRFFRYAAVELAYHHLGTLHEFSPSRTIGPITTLEVKSEMESTGATLALLGELPITDQWSVYLRAGGLFADQEVSRRLRSSTFSSFSNESYDSEVFLYGLGTQLDLGARWTVRLDFQRYDDVGKGNGIGEADVDALTLGVLFRLGAR